MSKIEKHIEHYPDGEKKEEGTFKDGKSILINRTNRPPYNYGFLNRTWFSFIRYNMRNVNFLGYFRYFRNMGVYY